MGFWRSLFCCCGGSDDREMKRGAAGPRVVTQPMRRLSAFMHLPRGHVREKAMIETPQEYDVRRSMPRPANSRSSSSVVYREPGPMPVREARMTQGRVPMPGRSSTSYGGPDPPSPPRSPYKMGRPRPQTKYNVCPPTWSERSSTTPRGTFASRSTSTSAWDPSSSGDYVPSSPRSPYKMGRPRPQTKYNIQPPAMPELNVITLPPPTRKPLKKGTPRPVELPGSVPGRRPRQPMPGAFIEEPVPAVRTRAIPQKQYVPVHRVPTVPGEWGSSSAESWHTAKDQFWHPVDSQGRLRPRGEQRPIRTRPCTTPYRPGR